MSNFERSKPVYSLETRADLPGAIVAAIAAGAVGEATLMRALHRGTIAHWQILPGSGIGEFKRFAAACRHRPTVVVVPADDYSDRGPESWPSARAAFRWAKKIVIHASGGTEQHYEAAIKAALICRRVLLVESSARAAPKWMALTDDTKPVLLIVPPPDSVHPILPAVMQ